MSGEQLGNARTSSPSSVPQAPSRSRPKIIAPSGDAAINTQKLCQQLFNEDDLVATGRNMAQGLGAHASDKTLEQKRNEIAETAKNTVQAAIPDMAPHGAGEIAIFEDERKQVRDTVLPARREAESACRKDHESIVSQLNQLGPPPPEPRRLIYLFTAALLGLVFGLVASTTLSEFIAAIMGLDPDMYRSQILMGGLGVGVLIGLTVGLLVILVGEDAIDGESWVLRQGPLVAGALFAIGLGGFRFLQTTVDPVDPTQVILSFHPTQIGIALLFIEFAILAGIEFVNQAWIHAWRRAISGSIEHKRLHLMVIQEKGEWDRAINELDEAEDDLKKSSADVTRLLQENYWSEQLKEHRKDLCQWVKDKLLEGFNQQIDENRRSTI